MSSNSERQSSASVFVPTSPWRCSVTDHLQEYVRQNRRAGGQRAHRRFFQKHVLCVKHVIEHILIKMRIVVLGLKRKHGAQYGTAEANRTVIFMIKTLLKTLHCSLKVCGQTAIVIR